MSVIVYLFVKSPRTASLVMRLPVQRLAVAAAIAGAVQVGPAHALGGGLKISQPGGVSADTLVTVTGAKINTKTGNLTGLPTSPFDLSFTLAPTPVAPNWSNGSDPSYSYAGSAIYTGLSSDILTGTFIQGGTLPSFLRVYRSGKIEFGIQSIAPIFPDGPPCYTGKFVSGASGTNCAPYLNVLNLTVQTGIIDFVPDSNPGTPSVGTLLSSFTGTYNVTGELKTGGAEGNATFSSRVPAPLPILGASMAYGFSRRLRKRIARSKSSALS